MITEVEHDSRRAERQSLDLLIEELVAADPWSLPVRLMEDVLAGGAAAVEPLVSILRDVRDHDDDCPAEAMWAAILLGQLRAATGALPLAEAIVRVSPGELAFTVAAAEALGYIGAPALPALRALAASERTSDRLWAYYAAGLMDDSAAYDFLLAALDTDAEMVDVIALALADYGDVAAIGPLRRAFERAESWQQREIVTAIHELQHSDTADNETADWRMRYRLNPMLARFPLSWAPMSAVLREDDEFREHDGRFQTLEQRLAAEATQELDVDRCECCDVPTWVATGVHVCPQTAAAMPLMQASFIKQRQAETSLDDVFDLLDDVEIELLDRQDEPKRKSRREREQQEDRTVQLRSMHAGLIWAAEQGVRSVAGASALLRAQALRAADEHGDPMGVFAQPPVPQVAVPRAGRNDPCPCGSGRKYKKCCAARDLAAAGAGELGRAASGRLRSDAESQPRRAGAGESGRAASGRLRSDAESQPRRAGDVSRTSASPPLTRPPQLVTFDHEPVSFSRAHYDVIDRHEVLRALRAHEHLDIEEDGERFIWFRPIDDDERRILGTIDVSRPDRLVLDCMSRERLDRGKELLDSVAGQWLVHRIDSEQDPWQAVAERQSRGERPPREDVPSEVARPLVENYLDKHYRSWPDEPLPALDGLTAREAVRDASGRRRVRELLRSFEEAQLRQPPAMRYDFGWIWQELGLTRE